MELTKLNARNSREDKCNLKKKCILEGTRELSRQLELVEQRSWREGKDFGGEPNILHFFSHFSICRLLNSRGQDVETLS